MRAIADVSALAATLDGCSLDHSLVGGGSSGVLGQAVIWPCWLTTTMTTTAAAVAAVAATVGTPHMSVAHRLSGLITTTTRA